MEEKDNESEKNDNIINAYLEYENEASVYTSNSKEEEKKK